MIGLKEACEKILSNHPGEYIHIVNEFETIYAFILLKDGYTIDTIDCLLMVSIVDKRTGAITEGLLGHEEVFQGDYRQYTREDLRGL